MQKKDNWEYYPTPKDLMRKAWRMFNNRYFARVLEPSAGTGELIPDDGDSALRNADGYRDRAPRAVDCVEIDIRKHAVLRERGFDIVGLDFLKMGGLASYSHIIMNPPFSKGARHVLHAWDGLFSGEIVAILNAETVRNPFSAERQRLAQIIEQYGSVEFVGQAFAAGERPTDVDTVLVHLEKKQTVDDLVSSWRDGLTPADRHTEPDAGMNGQVVLPRAEIETLVAAYNAGAQAAIEQAVATQKVEFYKSVLGSAAHGRERGESVEERVRESVDETVLQLRAGAWRSLLYKSRFSEKLASGARKRLEREFSEVSKLEFSLSNARSFVQGVLESAGQLQQQMACDAFDMITAFHSENRVWYRGWKSNDKHRTAGWRIKKSRFILPVEQEWSKWSRGIGYHGENMLRDLDMTFSMLDGLAETDYSLLRAARDRIDELAAGDRITTRYFDVRFYKGIGTMHFYPRSQKIMDRLNKMVGQMRGWLPPAHERVSKEFWIQYEQADKIARGVEPSFADARLIAGHYAGSGRTYDDAKRLSQAFDSVNQALAEAHVAAGITTAIEFSGGRRDPGQPSFDFAELEEKDEFAQPSVAALTYDG